MKLHLKFWREEIPLRLRGWWIRHWPWAVIRSLRAEVGHYQRWLRETEEEVTRLLIGEDQ